MHKKEKTHTGAMYSISHDVSGNVAKSAIASTKKTKLFNDPAIPMKLMDIRIHQLESKISGMSHKIENLESRIDYLNMKLHLLR